MATPKQLSRIDRTLSAVRRFWIQNPDLRLGQLLVCASTISRANNTDRDLFHVTDEQVEVQLERLHEEITGHKLPEED